jgi:hypothetical protein
MFRLGVRHVRPTSLEPGWDPDKSGSRDLTWDKAERRDMSGLGVRDMSGEIL